MRLNLFCTGFLGAVLPSTLTLCASAQSAQTVTVPMQSCGKVSAIIPVMLNGTGPYDFVLDTGTTIMLMDTALFHQLGLVPDGAKDLQTASRETKLAHSQVESVAVGPLAMNSVGVLGLSRLPLGPECGTVRGILGEQFLHHFDVLIDNQHRQVTLDAGTTLAESLDGERLPVITAPVPGADEYRPIVSVTVNGFDRHPVKMVLDSGASTVVMFQRRVAGPDFGGGMETVNGAVTCAQSMNWLVWGKAVSTVVAAQTCETSQTNLLSRAGNLPTSIFKQIFISHPGSYVIVNPVNRPHAKTEMAVAAPLS